MRKGATCSPLLFSYVRSYPLLHSKMLSQFLYSCLIFFKHFIFFVIRQYSDLNAFSIKRRRKKNLHSFIIISFFSFSYLRVEEYIDLKSLNPSTQLQRTFFFLTQTYPLIFAFYFTMFCVHIQISGINTKKMWCFNNNQFSG